MESQLSDNTEIVYVAAYDYVQFVRYEDDLKITHPNLVCVMIVDETTMRSRSYGIVKILPGAMERWDWFGVLESIERFEEQYKDHKNDYLTDESELVDYGGFEE